MIIIKSTNGDKLRLTPKRLTEIDHTSVDVDEEGDGEPSKYPFYTTKKDLQNALDDVDNRVKVYGHYEDSYTGLKVRHSCVVFFYPEYRQIGCKRFSPRTFALILKTMGLNK